MFYFLWAVEISCSTELSMKKLYNLRAWSWSKLFDTLIVFIEELFDNVDLEITQHEKLPKY